MAIKNKFIHFNTRAAFDNYLIDHADDLYNYTTFIKETSEIYTHGNFYKSSNTWDVSKLSSDSSYAEAAFKAGKLGDAIALSDNVFSILMSINNNSWSLQFGEAIQELLYNPESKLFSEGTTKILVEASSIPLGAISLPLSNGSAAIGNSDRYAKEDHIHPSDQSKQDKLISGSNIKTINNNSILGSGNIVTPDTKVTSAENHYIPTVATSKASGLDEEFPVNTINYDSRGHIVSVIKGTIPPEAVRNIYTQGQVYTKDEVDSKIASVYKVKGTLSNANALTSLTNVSIGDVYNITSGGTLNNTIFEPGSNFVAVKAGAGNQENMWDKLGGTIDLSSYVTNEKLSETLSSLSVSDNIVTHQYVTAVKQLNGKIVVSRSKINAVSIGTMAGYVKPSTTSSIVESDTLLGSIGKLEVALDNKVNTSQLNNYLPLAGGTVTGPLEIKTSYDSKLILNNTDDEVTFSFLEFRQKDVSQGKLGITNGGTYLRWNSENLATQPWIKSSHVTYNNEWNIIHKECKTNGGIFINCRASDISSAIDTPVTKFTFLTGTGKTDSANHASIQAKSFVTVGGTSSQMVRGDGSLAPIPTAYTLPTATSSVLGGVKVGSNITLSSGTISLSKSNVTSALGYTPANTSDIPEIPIALPNPYALTINGISYTGSSAVTITTPKVLTYASLGTSVSAGYIYYNTTAKTISTFSGFSLTNADAIIYSSAKITFSGSCRKMEGLANLSGSYYIYCLSWMPTSASAGIVCVNGTVYA